MRPVELVDPFVGTDSEREFSNGNVLPIMALPWGTHHYSPSNAEPDGWFFQYRARNFTGLRLTHSPSPWMGDWCAVTFLPQAGPRRVARRSRAVNLSSERLLVQPHRFGCRLPGLEWTAAPTMHGIAMEVHGPAGPARRLIIDTARAGDHLNQFDTYVRADLERGEVHLRTRGGGGDMHPEFALHLAVRADPPPLGAGIFGDAGEEAHKTEGHGNALGAWVEWPEGPGTVRVWAAGSFVGEAAAWDLLEREVAGRSAEDVARSAAEEWDRLLGRLELPAASETERRLAATMTYRTLLYPRRLDEPGPAGTPRYRCPDTGRVRDGVRVTDNGFWDTARTVYPWYSLLCPDELPTILEGWVEGARATGWLASWASPGHRACMTGSYSDAVFADALSRNIGGFDPAEVFEHLHRHASEPVADGSPFGREGLEAYLELGYVPVERIDKSVARTLDYAYGDWCLAVLADAAGEATLAEECRRRAGWWRHVLDPDTGFFRGRRRDGSWLEPFDPFEWGGPYVEGSAWQFAWHVPHQPEDVVAARGGPEAAAAFLQRLFAAPARYELGTHPEPIHEMREMASVAFGQYAHSNQPSHFTLPYWGHCGDPATMTRLTHRVLDELYALRPDGLPGDEDNGEMSAWWLCMALGLFPSCPGNGSWQLVRPFFRHAVLRVPGRTPLEIEVEASGDGAPADRWHGPGGQVHAAGQLLAHSAVASGGGWRVKDG